MTLADRFAAMDGLVTPIWVFDFLGQEMVWANAKALELWSALDLTELVQRDFKHASEAVRTRQLSTHARLERGEDEDRLITLYPKGKAVTVKSRVSRITHDDGRVLGLVQVLDANVDITPDLLRGVEAIRRIWAIVSLLDASGAILMLNPAGVRAFGDESSFSSWFVDEGVVSAIEAEVRAGRIFRGEVAVRTLEGERWHAVEAHQSLDPVTGAQATLVLQMDVTADRESRETIARQEQQIRALSAPILDVGQRALALPIIGALDEERSHAIAARLLPEVTARRAESVILDLTGVDTLDAAGAEELMGLVRAVQLLGARPIVTGIQPALATMLTGRGADLSGVATLRSLAEGLRACRRR